MVISIKAFVKRRSDISHEEFDKRWVRHGELVRKIPSFKSFIVQYTQYHLNPDSPAIVTAAGRTSAPYDGITDIEVNKIEDLLAFIETKDYAETITNDQETFMDIKAMTFLVGENKAVVKGL